MKTAHVTALVLCLITFTHAANADAFYSKKGGSALDITVWKAERSGTITLANGSTHVVGTGTAFRNIFLPGPGYATITDAAGTTVLGTIQSIENDENLTLTAGAGADYTDIAFTTESLPTIADDITINAGHAINAVVAGSFGIHHLTIEGTLTLDVLFFQIVGNLTINAGGVLSSTPTTHVVFDNISTIGGTAATITIDYLRVKSTGAVTLASDITVANVLEMEGGSIATGAHTLTLGTSAVDPGVFQLTGPMGMVSGTMKRWIGDGAIALGDTAGLFPMGAGANFRKVWIAKSHSGTGTISVTHTDASGITAFGSPFTENSLTFDERHNMHWAMQTGDSYAGLTDVRIQESGLDPGAMPADKLDLSLATQKAGGTYAASSVASGDTVVTRNGLDETDLSKTFYIASVSPVPLPVELTSFSGAARGKAIELRWNTATEKNNHGFDIERSGIGVQAGPTVRIWSTIGFVEGHGSTNVPQAYSFTDHSAGGRYAYRLKQIDRDGKYVYSKEIEATTALDASDYALTQNYPNPFNPSTTIRFALNSTQRAVVKVYNTVGQEVRTLFDGIAEANTLQEVVFDGRDLPSGMYFYTLRSGGHTDVKRMQLVK